MSAKRSSRKAAPAIVSTAPMVGLLPPLRRGRAVSKDDRTVIDGVLDSMVHEGQTREAASERLLALGARRMLTLRRRAARLTGEDAEDSE